MNPGDGEIDRGKNTASSGSPCFPRAATLHRVGVNPAAALLGKDPHRSYVRGIVRELELLDRRVSALDMLDSMKQLRIFAKSARYGAQSAYVLRVTPPGVVTAAVTVGYECRPH